MLIKKYWKALLVTFLVIMVFASVMAPRTEPGPLSIQSISPASGSEISIYPTFTATFNRAPTDKEQQSFVSRLSPDVSLKTSWSGPVFIATPSSTIAISTKYTWSITQSNSSVLTSSYVTLPIERFSIEDQKKLQSESDYQFGQEQLEYYKQKPWLTKLPIYAATYAAVYDSTFDGIRIRQKTLFTQQMKNEVISYLTSQGIPTVNIRWIEFGSTP